MRYFKWMIAAVVAFAFWSLRMIKVGKRETALGAAERYAKTRKKMDEANLGDDPAVLRQWLSERGSK